MAAQCARELMRAIDALANAEYAATMQWFFKTEPGGYGEGDVFVGVKMPVIRKAARPFRQLSLDDLSEVLASEIHEHRMAALVICSERAKRDPSKELYDFYLAHTARINNWDLVDVSCRDVVGGHLLATNNTKPLFKLARSKNMWERRIAIVSTWTFIRDRQLAPTFELSELLINDDHDLMHKAVGWMLREAGKKDEAALEAFLAKHAHELPRTALRYSIERLTPERRKYWLAYSPP